MHYIIKDNSFKTKKKAKAIYSLKMGESFLVNSRMIKQKVQVSYSMKDFDKQNKVLDTKIYSHN
jgi:hypothetical protein